MTPEQIAECFREAMNTPLARDERDVRCGVALAARRVAAACANRDGHFNPESFLRACGLWQL